MDILDLVMMFLVVHITSIRADYRQGFFWADSRYSESLPTNGIVWNKTEFSHALCASKCLVDSACWSYFYKENECLGYSNRMHDSVVTTASVNWIYFENQGSLGNVAVGKPAVQSSTYIFPALGQYGAFKAVDGRRYPIAIKPGDSCAWTKAITTEWWRVDLINNYLVTEVAILARVAPHMVDHVANVAITVGSAGTGLFTECVNTTGTVGWYGEFKTFTCAQPIYGRYVQLTKLTVKKTLSLCELEVFVN